MNSKFRNLMDSNDEIKRVFNLSMRRKLDEGFKEQLDMDVEFSYQEAPHYFMGKDDGIRSCYEGIVKNMPKVFERPRCVVIMKHDDDIVKRKGNGYMPGFYYIDFCHNVAGMRKMTKDYDEYKIVTNMTSVYSMAFHIEAFVVRSIHTNLIGYSMSDSLVDKLMTSNELEKHFKFRYSLTIDPQQHDFVK